MPGRELTGTPTFVERPDLPVGAFPFPLDLVDATRDERTVTVMDLTDSFALPKPPAQVLNEFRSAPNAAAWFAAEAGGYLYGAGFDAHSDTSEDDMERLAELVDNEFDRLALAEIEDRDVAMFRVEIHSPLGAVAATNWSCLPSPVFLLSLCAATASPGDVVATAHTYGDGVQVTRHETWPFDMVTAEQLTSPVMPEEIDAANTERELARVVARAVTAVVVGAAAITGIAVDWALRAWRS